MGNASSTQRGGKVTQSQTVLRESTNANTPKDVAQVVLPPLYFPLNTLIVLQAANTAKDNLITSNTEVRPKLCVITRHPLGC
jgi:hypothetical protein